MGCHNLLIIAIFFLAISNVKLSRHSRRNVPLLGDRYTLSAPMRHWGPMRQNGPTVKKQLSISVPATTLLEPTEAISSSIAPNIAILRRKEKKTNKTESVAYKNPFMPEEMEYPRPQSENKTIIIDKQANKTEVQTVNVMVQSFNFALKFVIILANINDRKTNPHMDPLSAAYYNKLYRVALSHISALPKWLGGSSDKYVDSHKLWTRKMDNVHVFVPNWLKRLIPWVKKSDWENEENTFRRFNDEVEMKHIFIDDVFHPGVVV